MNALKEWWDGANPRDQLALFILSSGALLYVLYMVLYSPVVNMRDKQIRKNAAAMEAQQRVRDMAAQVKQQSQSSGNTSGKSLVDIVSRSLSVNKLIHSGMQPSGNNNIRLRFDKVPFDQVLSWLNAMEMREGLNVNDISVASTTDSGLVSVNIRLSRP